MTASAVAFANSVTAQAGDERPAKRQRVPAEQRPPPESRCLVGGAFHAVPPELLRRVLGLLSAHDLSAAVSVTCRGLRAAAADNILWRRLYKARSGLRFCARRLALGVGSSVWPLATWSLTPCAALQVGHEGIRGGRARLEQAALLECDSTAFDTVA